MTACQQCGAELETPLGCGACGALAELEAGVSPFAIFGLAPAFSVDGAELKKRLKRFSRMTHPDFFTVQGDEARALAERNTASLNEAYEILSDDARRANWMTQSLGGPSDQDERQMPQVFLMEVLDWNETLEEAREAKDQGLDLADLETELTGRRAGAIETVSKLLDPLPDMGSDKLTEVRKQLNAIRYVDRALTEIKNLRLSRAASN